MLKNRNKWLGAQKYWKYEEMTHFSTSLSICKCVYPGQLPLTNTVHMVREGWPVLACSASKNLNNPSFFNANAVNFEAIKWWKFYQAKVWRLTQFPPLNDSTNITEWTMYRIAQIKNKINHRDPQISKHDGTIKDEWVCTFQSNFYSIHF